MNNKNLFKTISRLETKIDYFETEYDHLNETLIKCGFPEGIATLKMAAKELIEIDCPNTKENI